MTMRSTLILFLSAMVVSLLPACNDDDENGSAPGNTIDAPEGYSFLWSDEFDATLDPGTWTHQVGDGTDYGLPAGWGNNEKQLYTESAENASVMSVDGSSVLAITAREDGAGAYTSARLTTRDKLNVRFGRIDVRARMPEGQGLWPAIWMLGDNIGEIDWPGCGEIDIVEVLGHEPATAYSTIHYTDADRKKGEQQVVRELAGTTFSDDFHVFSLIWSPDAITFMVDGMESQPIPIGDGMKEFLRSFHFVVNVAVGGYWPGDPDATTVFPQTMYIDYIRVFKKDGQETPDAPPLDVEEETIGQVIEPNIGDNAIRDDFTDLGSLEVVVYGGGGEPVVGTSETAVDGDLSLEFDFPGGAWGGAYIELKENADLSMYNHLRFSLHMPETLVDAEIKLESSAAQAAIYLVDHASVPAGEGFVEYTIPLSAFTGLDLTDMRIPFAIWNPNDGDGQYVQATVLVDNVYFME